MSTSAIHHFSRAVVPTFDHPHVERRVVGNPLRTTWEHYASHDGQLSCGIWACEVGSWNIRFAADKEEFFCVIDGQVRLHDEAGSVVTVSAGEAAVIPAGFVGRFEVVQAVRKYFVVLQRSAKLA